MVGRVQRSVSAPLPPPSTPEIQRSVVNTRNANTEKRLPTGGFDDTHAKDLANSDALFAHVAPIGDESSVMFEDLPKSVQTDVNAYLTQYNAAESVSMSPRTREFLSATKGDDGFDITLLERDWTGKSRGEVSQRFGAAPLAPTGPMTTSDALTALDALPSATRLAIEAHIAILNEGEAMSLSPKTYTFVSATPLTDGGFSVVLMAKGFMGGGDASTHVLATDGSFR